MILSTKKTKLHVYHKRTVLDRQGRLIPVEVKSRPFSTKEEVDQYISRLKHKGT